MMVLDQYRALLVGVTGSVWDDTCWYLVVLDQYRAVPVGTWWYWVSEIGQFSNKSLTSEGLT